MGTTAGQLCARIVEARKAAGLSQADLARAADLPVTGMSKIETGTRKVSSGELARIARACGRTLDWFFGEESVPLAAAWRSSASSSEVLKDLAWASDLADAFCNLQRLVG